MMANRSAGSSASEECALWLRFDAGSVRLMARFGVHPAALVLSRDQYFEVNVLRRLGTAFVVQPLSVMNYKEMLNDAFSEVARSKITLSRPESITLAKVYFAFTAVFSEKFFGRVALTKNDMTSNEVVLVYNVDNGEYLEVLRENLFEMPRCMQEIPPLVFLAKAFDDSLIKSNEISYRCRIRDHRIGSPHDRADDDYPPYVICEISEDSIDERDRTAKFCTNDGSATGLSQKNVDISTLFPRFEYNVPHRLDVRIARKLSFDVYSVLNVDVLQKLSENMIPPKKHLIDAVIDGACDIACIAHVARPSKPGIQPSRLRFYRAIASRVQTSADTCRIYLIDYDQQVIGSIHALYDVTEQPPSFRNLPVAAFRLNVIGIHPMRNGVKTVKLEVGETYSVSLTANSGIEHKGTVSVPFSHVVHSTPKVNGDIARQRKKFGQKKGTSEEAEHFEKQLIPDEDIGKKKISGSSEDRKESTDNIEKELDILEQNKGKCEEVTLATIQLQCAHLSRQLDALAMDALNANHMVMPPPFYGLGNAATLMSPTFDQLRGSRPPLLTTASAVVPSCLGQSISPLTGTPYSPSVANGFTVGPPPSVVYQAGPRPPVSSIVIPRGFQQAPRIDGSEMNFIGNNGAVTINGTCGGHNTQPTVAASFVREQNFQSTSMPGSSSMRNLSCKMTSKAGENTTGFKKEKNVASETSDFSCKEAGTLELSRDDDKEAVRCSESGRMLSPERDKGAVDNMLKKDAEQAGSRREYRNRTGRYGVIRRAPACEVCKRDGHFAGSCPEAAKKSMSKRKGAGRCTAGSTKSPDAFGYSFSKHDAEVCEADVLSGNRYGILYTSDDDSCERNGEDAALLTDCRHASIETSVDNGRTSD